MLHTRKQIDYAIQLANAVNKGLIKPEYFEKLPIIVPEPHSNNNFEIMVDWTKFPDEFKEMADDAQVAIASFAIITCKESYPQDLRIENKNENFDLYSAQKIQQLVRNAMGHFQICLETGVARPIWDINSKDRQLFCIESIGVKLDATNLHGQVFKFSHLGGLGKYLDVLRFLENDLRNQINKINS